MQVAKMLTSKMRPDYLFRRGNVAVPAELKSRRRLGLVRKEDVQRLAAKGRAWCIGQAMDAFPKHCDDMEVYGALIQLLAYMLIFGCAVGILFDFEIWLVIKLRCSTSVSYTHLTLPTILLV